MTHYDAIVIGAGNAGLTAATALQRGGARTLLLERHNIPGGCATSFVRGDFEFEVALHQLSGMGTEEQPFVLRQLFDRLGIMDRLEIVVEHELYRTVLPGEFDMTLPADWNGLQGALCEAFPMEAADIRRFMQVCEALTMETFMSLPGVLRSGEPDLLDSTCAHFKEYGLRATKDVLEEFFDDPNLRAILAAYWCYLGMPPSELPFSDMAMLLYAYAAFKPTHVRGGSQAISSALLESFQSAGGTVQFNTGAHQIHTSGDRVVGVTTEHGARFDCDAVISNASAIHTFNELLDIPPPPQASQDMKSRRIGPSAFVLYLGLDCSPESLGIDCATNFVCSQRDEDVTFAAMRNIETAGAYMLTCYNLTDNSFAPPGKTVISLLCLQYGEPWEKLSASEYASTKYAMSNLLIDAAEQTFPGIRESIEEMEAATPLTMMRYLNTPGGAIYGFDQNAQDANMFRQRMDAVDGLYLAGCWSGMGGFQPTYMAGESTARAVLKQLKNPTQQQQEAAHA